MVLVLAAMPAAWPLAALGMLEASLRPAGAAGHQAAAFLVFLRPIFFASIGVIS